MNRVFPVSASGAVEFVIYFLRHAQNREPVVLLLGEGSIDESELVVSLAVE